MEKKKQKYKVTNWSEYNKGLVNRGKLSIWISQDVIKNWSKEEKTGERGSSNFYTDRAIETCLTLKYIYNLTLRATEGFVQGISELAKLNLQVPNYSTIGRRGEKLKLELNLPRKNIEYVVIDSTGLKVYGEGEWKVRKHGYSKRRTWKKLHLAVDSESFDIVAMELTDNSTGDSEVLEDLVKNIDGKIEKIALDGAYDTKGNYNSLIERDIKPIIPPREGAVPWEIKNHPRNLAIDRIKEVGKKEWKKEIGYHTRSLAETSMFRFKTIFGGILNSRLGKSQKVESILKCKIINRMNKLGMPISISVL
jgi:hypothetical protein